MWSRYCGKARFAGILAVALWVLSASAQWASAQKHTSGNLEEIPESKPLPHDVIHLTNGDKISGTIAGLDGDTLLVQANLVDGPVRVPFEHVRLVLFRSAEKIPEAPHDRLVFPNGDRLSVTLTSLAEGSLKAATSAGENVSVKTDWLTGIIFERKPYAVYENDFEDGKLKGLKPGNGQWVVENGLLKQTQRNASFSTASIEIVQDGRFQFDWVADLVGGNAYGFYFFAGHDDAVHGGTSYLIMVQGQSVYLYKVQNDNQQYYANYTLPKRDERAKFRLDYDPANGHIILTVDGKNVFRYRDPAPITSGRYVTLRTDNVGSFDNIAITRLGGGRILPDEAKARGRDIICLANNDEVSGEVISIDDATLLMKTDYDEDPVDIQRDYVSSLTFYRQAARSTEPGTTRIALVNGDTLTGKLISLDDETIVVESPVVGRISLARALARELSIEDHEGRDVGALDDHNGANVAGVEFVNTDAAHVIRGDKDGGAVILKGDGSRVLVID
ncbi:MAG: hypothetical protein JW889_04450 [Verrucomicrobia bacterium]|nr:hypothetical protein [Verrucomicrobiota bacterium]